MSNNSDKSDEIDLVVIFQGIKRLFISFIMLFVHGIRLIRKRWLIFLLFISLGIGAGYGLFINSKPVYISSLTLSAKILTNDYCANIVGNLGEVVSDNTPELLAKKLNIDISVANEIRKIEFSNFNEKLSKMYEGKDTIVLGIPFKIIVQSYNNRVFTSLETALVNYLENNEYSLKRKEIKKQNLESLRSKLRSDMTQLDSLKKNISENILPRGTTSGFVFGQPIDPINIYKSGQEMFRADLNLKEEIQLIDGIQVVDSFSPRDKPDSPILWKKITIGVFLSLVLAFLIAYRLEKKQS